jgi:DNA-binding PucR family transcriptional regulator
MLPSHDRSLVRAAEQLHVARNTVAYRVKKFEKLAGRDLKDRRLELEAALRLAAVFRSAVLDQP